MRRAEEDRTLGRRRGIYMLYRVRVSAKYIVSTVGRDRLYIILYFRCFFLFFYVSPTTTCVRRGRVQHKQEIIRFEKRYRLRCYIRVIWICVGGSSRSG